MLVPFSGKTCSITMSTISENFRPIRPVNNGVVDLDLFHMTVQFRLGPLRNMLYHSVAKHVALPCLQSLKISDQSACKE